MANSSPFASSLDGLVVNTKAAAVYAAHEGSLFLSGGLVPQIAVPAGSITAQVPFLEALGSDAEVIDAYNDADDLTSRTVVATPKNITANIYAARTILRDLGAIDPAEVGRVLGNAVAKKFDQAVITAMNGLTASTSDSDPVTVDSIFDAVAQIRGAGEMGQLFGILSPAQAALLMKAIGTQAYAGGDFQTEALRNGFVGSVGGVRMFQSAYISGTNKGFIFGADALRIAMFKNVDLEVQRRASAVGNDLVVSLHAGVGLVDAARGVKLVNV
jgi:hypothetical protein